MDNHSPLLIESRILIFRGQKVIIDADLAQLYGVTTKRLNEQLKRNLVRFPADFMFRLTSEEKLEVVANCEQLAKLRLELALRLDELERKTDMTLVKQAGFERDAQLEFKRIIETLRQLMTSPQTPTKRPIGFITPDDSQQ
jgi:hypothetical protein